MLYVILKDWTTEVISVMDLRKMKFSFTTHFFPLLLIANLIDNATT